ncbi:MAG: hypothetical protein DI547_12285 [Sphingobium sp.]|nr:MAG: hypothetical protein DI547_12285 [Sphingobium sp.]
MEHMGTASPALVSLVDRMTETTERRNDKRHMTVLRVGKLTGRRGEELCLIRNISDGGLMAHVYAEHQPASCVTMEIRNGHVLSGTVAWARPNRIGVAFDERIDVLAFLANEQEEMIGGMIPRAPRISARTGVVVRRGAHYVHARLEDISLGGAKVTEGEAFDADDDVVLMVQGLPPRAGTIRWRREGRAGIGFNETVPFEELAQWVVRHPAPVAPMGTS